MLGPVAVLNVVPLGNNLYVQIGLVLLIALSAKNAILIVEVARELRQHGKEIVEAAIEAARSRFRPILMTSFAFILGMVPLVLATRRRRQLAHLDRHHGGLRHDGVDLPRGLVRARILRHRAALRGMARRRASADEAGGARRRRRNRAGGQMELGLAGKVALVTGSSRGIGRGIAVTLAQEGCDLVLTGTDETALKDAAAAVTEALGRKAKTVAIDLRKDEAPAALIDAVKSRLRPARHPGQQCRHHQARRFLPRSPTPTGPTAMR